MLKKISQKLAKGSSELAAYELAAFKLLSGAGDEDIVVDRGEYGEYALKEAMFQQHGSPA